MTTFAKDWAPPRSLRSSTSMPMGGVANPSGTTLHVMVNTRIPCNEEAFKKHGKSHASMTIVAIKKIGYVYAPWKKTPKKGEAKEATKKLFDSPVMVKNKNEQIYGEVSVYSFSRVGKSDKGPRNDALKGKIEVGQTLHFMLHQFMFERKSKGESVFPEGMEFIEPFSMVELVVGAGVDEQATQGYGIKIDTIRPLPFSMYSYLIPVYMDILEDTPERIHQKVTEGTKEEGGDYYTLRQVLETTSVGFLVKVDPASYLVELKDGEDKSFYRVVVEGDDKMVAEGVNMVDVMEGDLLKFTNAGDNVKYAHLLVDMAAAGGHLYMWVFRNEYFTSRNQTFCEFRGVPLIYTQSFLDFVDIQADSEDPATKLNLPWVMPTMTSPQFTVAHEPVEVDGDFELTCEDFVLCSDVCKAGRAYPIWVGPEQKPTLFQFYFRSYGGNKLARSGGVGGAAGGGIGARMMWDELA